jgi:amino acid transporter
VTATATVSTPGQTTGITGNHTTVAVNPLSTTASDSGSGVPWWGWVLIGLGVVGVAVAIFQLGRGRRDRNGGGGPGGASPEARAGGSPTGSAQ